VSLRTKEAVGSVNQVRWLGATIPCYEQDRNGVHPEIERQRNSNSERHGATDIDIEERDSNSGPVRRVLHPWCSPSDLP
jgi:hypothetical protein